MQGNGICLWNAFGEYACSKTPGASQGAPGSQVSHEQFGAAGGAGAGAGAGGPMGYSSTFSSPAPLGVVDMFSADSGSLAGSLAGSLGLGPKFPPLGGAAAAGSNVEGFCGCSGGHGQAE